jgi:hypothetical protein
MLEIFGNCVEEIFVWKKRLFGKNCSDIFCRLTLLKINITDQTRKCYKNLNKNLILPVVMQKYLGYQKYCIRQRKQQKNSMSIEKPVILIEMHVVKIGLNFE